MKIKRYFCDWLELNFVKIWVIIAIILILANSAWLFAFFGKSDLELFVAMSVVATGVALFEFILVYRIIWKKYEESVTKKQEDNEEDNDF